MAKTIKQVAEALGLAKHSLKRYEREGVVQPARDSGGYRRYTEDDVARIVEYQATRRPGARKRS